VFSLYITSVDLGIQDAKQFMMQTGCFDHILCMLTFSFDLTTVIY
jgi:hypothetical protein